jgi:hypothetical protein
MFYLVIKVNKDIIKVYSIKVVSIIKKHYIYILLVYGRPINKFKRQDLILI